MASPGAFGCAARPSTRSSREDGAGVWADTDLEVQLQNRGKSPVVLPIGIPGPQATAFTTVLTSRCLKFIDASVDKQAADPLAAAAGEQPGMRASAVITLPVQGTVVAALALPPGRAGARRSGRLRLSPPAGNVWAGAPESLSVAFTFKPPLAGEQIMHVTPGSRDPRPGVY